MFDDCLYDVMDIDGWFVLLCWIESGVIEFIVCDLFVLLLFVVEIFNVKFYVFFDDVLFEECCM